MICKFVFRTCLTISAWLVAFSPTASSALDSDLVKPSLHTGYRVNLCADLIKECLGASKDDEKTACLHSTSRHMFCEGGPLGQLAYRRWAFSPDPGSEEDDSIDPPDPVLVDQQCIASFDSRLTSELMRGNFENEKLDELRGALNSCIKEAAPPMFRP